MTRLSDVSRTLPIFAALSNLQKAANRTSLEHQLIELVKIRASQLNGCAFCLSMHVRDTLNAGERIDRVAVIPAWRECDWFTDRERAALTWTEALTDLAQHHIPDDTWDLVRGVFSEDEIVELTLAIIAINGWNRLNVAFQTAPDAFELKGSTHQTA